MSIALRYIFIVILFFVLCAYTAYAQIATTGITDNFTGNSTEVESIFSNNVYTDLSTADGYQKATTKSFHARVRQYLYLLSDAKNILLTFPHRGGLRVKLKKSSEPDDGFPGIVDTSLNVFPVTETQRDTILSIIAIKDDSSIKNIGEINNFKTAFNDTYGRIKNMATCDIAPVYVEATISAEHKIKSVPYELIGGATIHVCATHKYTLSTYNFKDNVSLIQNDINEIEKNISLLKKYEQVYGDTREYLDAYIIALNSKEDKGRSEENEVLIAEAQRDKECLFGIQIAGNSPKIESYQTCQFAPTENNIIDGVSGSTQNYNIETGLYDKGQKNIIPTYKGEFVPLYVNPRLPELIATTKTVASLQKETLISGISPSSTSKKTVVNVDEVKEFLTKKPALYYGGVLPAKCFTNISATTQVTGYIRLNCSLADINISFAKRIKKIPNETSVRQLLAIMRELSDTKEFTGVTVKKTDVAKEESPKCINNDLAKIITGVLKVVSIVPGLGGDGVDDSCKSYPRGESADGSFTVWTTELVKRQAPLVSLFSIADIYKYAPPTPTTEEASDLKTKNLKPLLGTIPVSELVKLYRNGLRERWVQKQIENLVK
ncbi:MAG: hypothetical protein QM526_00200 [Alphaproteobacteria bacterium]|nr:hypothetical protein [Alphaproteobacteria bacterium]